MIVSEARREANRLNALRSTGPRTEAGKDRSRRNALTHGLSARVVGLPEDEAVVTRAAEAGHDLDAGGFDWQGWLVDEVAVIATRLRRSERLELDYRERVVLRAELSWDDDRRSEVEALGAKLGDDPSGVTRALRMSPQGCDWMIERWSLLARAADRDRKWTVEQQVLAFALLGRPSGLQGGFLGESVDPEGRPDPASLGLGPAALARQEVAGLVLRKAERAALDAFDRTLARGDSAPDDADPALRKLHRHEAALHRRLRWCVGRIEQGETAPRGELPRPAPPAPSPVLDAPAAPIPIGPARPEARFRDSDFEVPARSTPARRPDPRALKEKARRAARSEAGRIPLGRKTNPTGGGTMPSIRADGLDKLGPG